MTAMLEKDWQAKVTDLAKLLGWRVYSTRAAFTGKGYRTPVTSRGFPDLLLVREGRLVAAELKVGSPLAPEQREWLDELGKVAGVESFVWKPADFDQIVEILRPQFGANGKEPQSTLLDEMGSPVPVCTCRQCKWERRIDAAGAGP